VAATVSKPVFIGVWVSRDQRAELVRAAREADVSLSAFVRRSALKAVARLDRQHARRE